MARRGLTLLGGAIAFAAYVRWNIHKNLRGTVNQTEAAITSSTATSLTGRRAIVVGGTSGIGYAIAQELKRRGAVVTVAGRTQPPDASAALSFVKCDLTTLSGQRSLASSLVQGSNPDTFDYVILAAGTLAREKRVDNGDGIELDLAVSCVSRRVILDELLQVPGFHARVFLMGYCGVPAEIKDFNGRPEYERWTQHVNTDVCNDALVLGYRTHFPKAQIWGLNPGLIGGTHLRDDLYGGKKWMRDLSEWFISLVSPRTVEEYGSTAVDILTFPHLSRRSVFFNLWGESLEISPYLQKANNVNRIWNALGDLISTKKT